MVALKSRSKIPPGRHHKLARKTVPEGEPIVLGRRLNGLEIRGGRRRRVAGCIQQKESEQEAVAKAVKLQSPPT